MAHNSPPANHPESRRGELSRRDLLRATALSTAGAALALPENLLAATKPKTAAKPKAAAGSKTGPNPRTAPPKRVARAATPPLVPTRPFGRSRIPVSTLGLGMMFDAVDNQLVLKRAHDVGVRYWDTADCYTGGRSEKGVGRYFKRFPAHRKDIFLVSKSDDRDPEGMDRLLTRTLRRTHAGHVDLYLLHAVHDIDELDDKVRRWAEKAKKQGRIKLFGFSSHDKDPKMLMAASKLSWIDGLLISFNHDLMKHKATMEAVQACHEAGIGLAAMKLFRTSKPSRKDPNDNKNIFRHIDAGFSDEQARLRGVLGDPRIATALVTMKSTAAIDRFAKAAR